MAACRLVPLALAGLLALAALPIPAGAFHNPGVPLLDTAALAGDGYAAWRVSAPNGTKLSFEVLVTPQDSRMVGLGLWMLRADDLGVRLAIIGGSWTYGGITQLHVQLPDPLGTVLSSTKGGPSGTEGTAVDVVTHEAREWILLAIGATDGGLSGTVSVYGGAGAELRGRTTGSAFLHREPDFKGLVNAYAVLPVRNAQVFAKAVRDGAVSEPVQGRLFGMFAGSSSSTGELQMGYDGPDGAHDGQTFYPFHGAAPGSYRFRLDHNVDYYDTGPLCGFDCENPHVWAYGADVALP